MKNWLKNKFDLAVIGIIALVATVYRDSFVSPFFQDDKILLDLSRSGKVFQVIPNFPYRPVSQQLFFWLAQNIFGNQVFGYHLVLFLTFAVTVYVIFHLAVQLLRDKKKAGVATFFYALNISLFANFFWLATSYFVIGALFFFLAIFFYVKKRSVLGFVIYLLALGSNEVAFVLPMIFIFINWYLKFWTKSLFFYLVSLPVFFGLRLAIGLPKATDYSLSIESFVSNLRWYLFRIINLPEAVQRGSDNLLPISFVVFLAILFISLLVYIRNRPNWRLFILATAIFVLGALPFFFLPGHMSSYYLTMALFGPALLVGETVTNRKLISIFVLAYLLLTMRGLDFLSKTHWIILKNTGPIGKF